MKLDRLGQRFAGLVVILVSLTVYEPGEPGITQRLLLPLLLGAGTWALVQNLAVVALTGTVLAAIHMNPGADDWIAGIAYPLLAVIGAITLIVIGVQRFRARVQATHEARWARRRTQQ